VFRKISEGPNIWTDADGVSRLCCLLFFILLVLVSTTLDLIDTYIPSPPQTDQGGGAVFKILEMSYFWVIFEQRY